MSSTHESPDYEKSQLSKKELYNNYMMENQPTESKTQQKTAVGPISDRDTVGDLNTQNIDVQKDNNDTENKNFFKSHQDLANLGKDFLTLTVEISRKIL